MTKLLLQIGGRNIIVEVDKKMEADVVRCSIPTLIALVNESNHPNGKAAKTAPEKPAGGYRRKPRLSRYRYAVPPNVVEAVRATVTDPLPRGVFEGVVLNGESSGTVARRLRVHITSVNNHRRRMDREFNLLKYRAARND